MRCWMGLVGACVLGVASLGCGETGGGAAGSSGAGGQGGGGGTLDECVENLCPCSEEGIRLAIAEGGGPFTFACDGPTTVYTDDEILIDKDVALDGEGNLAVDGQQVHRVFSVTDGVTVELARLKVQRGELSNDDGGGILNQGTLLLTECAFEDNSASAGGAILNEGTLTITDTSVQGNRSSTGAVVSRGTLTVTRSTLMGNGTRHYQDPGGDLANVESATLVNSTLGRVINMGEASFANCTIGSVLALASDETEMRTEMRATIVESGCSDLLDSATWVSDGYNVAGSNDTCAFNHETDLQGLDREDIGLGPLEDHGGPTETRALLAGSVALDRIPAGECDIEEDQRGIERPQATACDVGAFEAEPCESAGDCDDENECTADACELDGSCSNVAVENDTACDLDGASGACMDGVCVDAMRCLDVNCDDGDECTDDWCDPATGLCENPTSEDGSQCTGGACIGGECLPLGNELPCTESAIRTAIATGGGPYTFDCDAETTIVTSSDFYIGNDVILDGEGKIILDAGRQGHRVLWVGGTATAELRGFVIARGEGASQPEFGGGGVHNAGSLTLRDVLVTYNYRGGIFNSGTLHVIDTVVSENAAGVGGGGIINHGDLFVSDSEILGNASEYGAGIGNVAGSFGTAVLTRTRIAGNRAYAASGGVNVGQRANATVVDCLIEDNEAGEDAAGIGVDLGGELFMSGTTIAGNEALTGDAGGVGSAGRATISNSTISGNIARNRGGGLGVDTTGSVTLVNSTVAANEAAAGDAIANLGSLISRGNIVHGSCQTSNAIDSQGFNLESDGDSCDFDLPSDMNEVSGAALGLLALADNGGPTPTHALSASSVAIDVIAEAECLDPAGDPLTQDQRGVERPQETMCDVGAFELVQGGL